MECICLLCVLIFYLHVLSPLLGCSEHLKSKIGVCLLLVASSDESRQMGMPIGFRTQKVQAQGLSRPFPSPCDLGSPTWASALLTCNVRKQDSVIPKVSAFLNYDSKSQPDLELEELELFSVFIINFFSVPPPQK